MQKLKIGELAKHSGLTVEALRFYEQQQLIQPQGRTASGYRLYLPEDVQRVKFILHSKKAGFTLAEIKTLLELRLNKDEHSCDEVKQYTAEKIADVEARLQDLNSIHQALTHLHDACCGGSKSATHCTILSSLEDDLFTHREKK